MKWQKASEIPDRKMQHYFCKVINKITGNWSKSVVYKPEVAGWDLPYPFEVVEWLDESESQPPQDTAEVERAINAQVGQIGVISQTMEDVVNEGHVLEAKLHNAKSKLLDIRQFAAKNDIVDLFDTCCRAIDDINKNYPPPPDKSPTQAEGEWTDEDLIEALRQGRDWFKSGMSSNQWLEFYKAHNKPSLPNQSKWPSEEEIKEALEKWRDGRAFTKIHETWHAAINWIKEITK